MTAYADIPNAAVAPDADATSVTAIALRDNLFAVIEGDATAIAAGRQIKTAALEDGAVTLPKLTYPKVFSGVKSGSGNIVLDATMDWRGRFITMAGGACKGNDVADVQSWIPGGGDDEQIYFGLVEGASPHVAATVYIPSPYFMYSHTGSAAYNAIPYIKHASETGVAYIYLWVSSANGSLNLYCDVPVGKHTGYNLLIG